MTNFRMSTFRKYLFLISVSRNEEDMDVNRKKISGGQIFLKQGVYIYIYTHIYTVSYKKNSPPKKTFLSMIRSLSILEIETKIKYILKVDILNFIMMYLKNFYFQEISRNFLFSENHTFSVHSRLQHSVGQITKIFYF